ncbi:C-C motif chemokine 13-like [Clarias magur]|uniref:C-C motif chemokine 13-like n=1 Tax=Clarias magur TaxID=1594786 RepID=A0A8J4T2Q5_CLAMG|nr:C-C motif chemokine 13-like [Clarias magur]
MKMTRVCLVLGFVLIMALYLDAQQMAVLYHEAEALAQPEDCCFTFFSSSVPSQNILEAKRTGEHCSQQGFMRSNPIDTEGTEVTL